MSSVAVRRGAVAWSLGRAGAGARVAEAVALGALALASVALRSPGLADRLWMDEGIAVGIASHPLTAIPGVLRLDGSPPLYYLLLHAWMGLAGRSELAVHWLSLAFAGLCVPAAWWAGASSFARRVGWTLAVLVACSPFLTSYAAEARMYALLVLLCLVCVGCFADAYLRRRRRFAAPFGLALALCLYTHNWALLLAVALAAAWCAIVLAAARGERRALLRDGALGFGLAGLLYVPWLPTLLFQAAHTGAPWATAPAPAVLVRVPADLLGGTVAAAVAGVVCGAGLVRRARRTRAWVEAVALLVPAGVPVLLGWGLSQLSPAWDMRYLAVVLAPLLAAVAVGLVAARRWGAVALAVIVALWLPGAARPTGVSDAWQLARAARPLLRAGDLVVSTPIGQVPLLAYYLPAGLRYASPFGLQRDPRVVDWRDAARHLARTSTRAQLLPLLARAPAGSRVLLVTPVRWDARSRHTALGRRERRRSAEYERALARDRRFERVAAVPVGRLPADGLRGVIFRKR